VSEPGEGSSSQDIPKIMLLRGQGREADQKSPRHVKQVSPCLTPELEGCREYGADMKAGKAIEGGVSRALELKKIPAEGIQGLR
jgi:hypothetical protein